MKFACQTLFDITATGTTGHFKSARLPYKDRAGATITDIDSWNYSRNQQRNWETIIQILGLRTQIFSLTTPVKDQSGTRWMFEFETESAGIYGPDSDPTSVLRSDSAGVPMIRSATTLDIQPFLITEGENQNIWFLPISINN